MAALLLPTVLPHPSHVAVAADCIDYAEYLHWESVVDAPGATHDLAIADDYAFLVHGHPDPGLSVVDLLAPGGPTLVATVPFTPSHEDPVGIAIQGKYAYVVREVAETLDVFDISTPITPVPVGSVVLSGEPKAVAVMGAHAYVTGVAGLDVVDVSVPATPTLAGFVDTGYSTDVDVAGILAYVAADGTELHVVNVSDPTTPTIVGTSGVNSHRVTVVGSYAYVSDQTLDAQAVHVIYVGNPNAPVLRGTVAMPDQPHEIAVSGGYAFVANLRWALQVVDVTTPTNPTIVGSVRSVESTHGIALDGDRAYLASSADGMEIVDITNPASPSLVEWLYGPGGSPEGFVVEGTNAYVAGGGILHILDVTDPDTPTILGTFDDDLTWGGSVAKWGSTAYVTDESAGIRVVDVSNAFSPTLVRTIPTTFRTYEAAVHDGYLYASYAYADIDPILGYYLYDLAIPGDPQLVLNDSDGVPGGYAFAGDVAFLGSDPLRILDVTDPTTPIVLATLAIGGSGGLFLDGDDLYVANLAGLHVIDVSDPTSPSVAQSIGLSGCRQVVVQDGIAYVHRARLGMWVVHLASETVLGNIGPTFLSTADVALIGDAVYYAAPGGGLAVWPPQCALIGVGGASPGPSVSVPALYARPNPFSSSAQLSFEVPAPGRVFLDLFDATGRRQATRDLGWRSVGIQVVRWEDDTLGPGVYFARIRTHGGVSAPARLVNLGAR